MLPFTQTAASADLTDIRTGFHRTYSRVVVQFDSDVKFQVIKDVQNGTVILDVLGVNSVRNFGEINLDKKDRYLKHVRFKRSPNLLSVTIILKISNPRVDHYYLQRPFRIVLDIYPTSIFSKRKNKKSEGALQSQPQQDEQMLTASGSHVDSLQSAESDSIHPSEVDLLAISTGAEDSLVTGVFVNYDSTETLLNESIIPLQTSLNSVKSELQKIAMKRTSRQNRLMSKYTLIFVMVTAFVLFDLILAAFYLKRRSKKTNRPLPTGKKVVKNQPASMQTSREFVEVLKSTLESSEIEEVKKEPEVVQKKGTATPDRHHRRESMSRSVLESVNAPGGPSPSPPELAEVARDLGSIAPRPGAAKEVTEEELIGKDGAEFLKNLQKQSLN